MRRRDFIAGIGGAAAWPLLARAQQQVAIPVVGYLSTADSATKLDIAFKQGLESAGYIDGRNLKIEYRRGAGKYESLPAMAADLVKRQVAVIAAIPTHIVPASAEADFDAAFANAAEARVGALMIAPDPFFTGRSERLAALALRYALPAAYEFHPFSAAGGLLSYGGDIAEAYRLAGDLHWASSEGKEAI